MSQKSSIVSWLDDNRDMGIEALRIYLGIDLTLKGLQFILNKDLAVEYLSQVYLPVILVLFLLLFFTVYGSGRLSVDNIIEKRRSK